jgi:hypothetical protein
MLIRRSHAPIGLSGIASMTLLTNDYRAALIVWQSG